MRTPPSLIGVTVALLAGTALAQPMPTLSAPTPVYLQRSESQELTLAGTSLTDASAVALAGAPGVSGDLLKPEPAGKPTPAKAKLKLAAGPHAALGTRELRLVTPLGVTAPVSVTVGQFPAVRDREPNNAAEQATAATLPAALVGRVDVGGDVDCYRFDARKGDRLVFDVYAARVGSPLDPVVSVLDARARELPTTATYRGGPTGGGDLTIAFDPPADGSYTLAVRDVQYRGGPDYAYRIDAGAIPFVESVVPASGPRGTKVRVRVVGYNLANRAHPSAEPTLPGPNRAAAAAGEEAERTIDLTTAEAGTVELRFRTPGGWSNAVPFVVVDAGLAAEGGTVSPAKGQAPAGAARGRGADADFDAETAEDAVEVTAASVGPGAAAERPRRVVALTGPTTGPSNQSADSAARVSLPAEASGLLAAAGEERFYRFAVAAKQAVIIGAKARAIGSPVDALLTLRDAKGNVVEQSNGAGEAEARIARPLEPGEYVASVRDLTFAGGPNYAYRLSFLAGAGAPADFAVRFLPDAPRLARGGQVKLWGEVVRLNGYKGDVAVTLDGLPSGVTVSSAPGGPAGSATIGEQTSGVFTLTASPDAALGSVPITLQAVGSVGGKPAVRFGESELNGRPVRGTYLTVLDKPPFTIDSVAAVTPAQLATYPAEVQALDTKVNTPTPALEKAQAAWEASVGAPIEWRPLAVTSASAAGGTVLKPLPDGSILAPADKSPEHDTYAVVGTASLKQIAAVRLEVLADPSLPASGPGRNVVGNFVLNKLTATVAPKADPAKAQPITFASGKATFEQGGYGIAGAIDDKPETGWAIFGGTGKSQTAWLFPDKPVPAGDVVVTVTLDQQFGQQHTLGRFRLAVTDDPEALKRQTDDAPAAVAGALKTPVDKRAPDQKLQLAAYYRSIAPELKAERARLDVLKNTVGPPAEVARLEAALAAANPAIDAERREWEQSVAAGIGWIPVEVTTARAASGTLLSKEPDDSVSAAGPVPATETYTVVGKTSLRAVTAVRLEALPDERYPANGPGRAGGNFVLTRFGLGVVAVTPAGAKPMNAGKAGEATPESTPVPLREARATFEQTNFPVAGTLDGSPETGWAVAPLAGVAHAATYFPRAPIVGGEGGSTLAFTLEFNSPKFAGFTLGRFRLWALGAADPAAAATIPGEVQDVLKVPEEKRSESQKAELSAFYRTISPALEPTRQRLAELQRKLPTTPLVVPRGKGGTIPVPIARSADFIAAAGGSAGTPAGFSGPVQVTLEGFSAGRDPQTRQPALAAKNLDVSPLTVDPQSGFARLTIRPKPTCELGTRMVVLRAEAKIGDATYVQYSPAFPITVVEK